VVAANPEQIRSHLCYELKWMLRAVVSFEHVTAETRAAHGRGEPPPDSDLVALQDSALLHARHLVQFASASSDPNEPTLQWALSDILGSPRRKVPAGLSSFLHGWVVPLGALTRTGSKWPKDLAGNRIDMQDDARLSKVAEVVFKVLKPKHRTTTLETEEGVAYVELLDRAREYFEQRTPEAFNVLTCVGVAMPAPALRHTDDRVHRQPERPVLGVRLARDHRVPTTARRQKVR
jgi:hypothetical protein